MNYLKFLPLCIVIRILGPTQYEHFKATYSESYPVDKYVECLDGGAEGQLKKLLDKYKTRTTGTYLNNYIGQYPESVLNEITKQSSKYIDDPEYKEIYSSICLVPDLFHSLLYKNLSKSRQLEIVNSYIDIQTIPSMFDSHYISMWHVSVEEFLKSYKLRHDELSIENQKLRSKWLNMK